jgi:FtsP/CotA-like multicopper oxidase with cupredoxin domain
MNRREFIALAAAAPLCRGQNGGLSLSIAPLNLEIGPKRFVKTIAYNGQVPGPLVRVREGETLTVNVTNQTGADELVHWHGLHIPPDVDGSMEEGTPMIPAHGSRSYTFTATPAGTRWYHTHIGAGRNFQKGTYTGQFGMIVIEPTENPGAYDLDIPLMLHGWEASLPDADVEYRAFTVNGRMLGAGEPVKVTQGQRVLLRFVNASASMTHRLSLAGHRLRVIALDGNPVPNPQIVDVAELGPGERVDAVVECDNPGRWVLGETRDSYRNAGLGVVLEYAGQTGAPRWLAPPESQWDYAIFGADHVSPDPDGRIPMLFKPHGEHGWTINGKSFPKTDAIVVRQGRRYRMVFDNQSAMAHPVHLHRHTFELTKVAGKRTAGIRKDVAIVPAWKEVEVDLVADQPGLSLFHCHHQLHMDMGFMALMRYSDR